MGIQQQISHCGANVEQERQGRERDTRRLEEALHAQQDESHAMLQRVRQEMERSIDVEAQSTRERFAEVKGLIDGQDRERVNAETAMSRKISEGLFDVQNSFGDQLQKRDHEMSKAVRVLEDKIQVVTQSVERDREHNHVAIRKVQEEVNREREQLEEFEESIMRLVDDQLSKLHHSIENHPGAG